MGAARPTPAASDNFRNSRRGTPDLLLLLLLLLLLALLSAPGSFFLRFFFIVAPISVVPDLHLDGELVARADRAVLRLDAQKLTGQLEVLAGDVVVEAGAEPSTTSELRFITTPDERSADQRLPDIAPIDLAPLVDAPAEEEADDDPRVIQFPIGRTPAGGVPGVTTHNGGGPLGGLDLIDDVESSDDSEPLEDSPLRSDDDFIDLGEGRIGLVVGGPASVAPATSVLPLHPRP